MTSRENFYEDWKNPVPDFGPCYATKAQCNGTAPCESQGACNQLVSPLSCKYDMPSNSDMGGSGRCLHAPYNWYNKRYDSCPMYIKPTGRMDMNGNMTYCYGPDTTDKDSYTPTSVDISNNYCGLGQEHSSRQCPRPGNPRLLCGSGPGVL